MNNKEKLLMLFERFHFTCYQSCKIDSALKNCKECQHEQLADYLLENGVIFLPPKELFARIGDCMYCITDETDEVIEVIVCIIEIDCEGQEWIRTGAVDYVYEIDDEIYTELNFHFADIGKTLFFTSEKAEKALRERDNHD